MSVQFIVVINLIIIFAALFAESMLRMLFVHASLETRDYHLVHVGTRVCPTRVRSFSHCASVTTALPTSAPFSCLHKVLFHHRFILAAQNNVVMLPHIVTNPTYLHICSVGLLTHLVT